MLSFLSGLNNKKNRSTNASNWETFQVVHIRTDIDDDEDVQKKTR